MNILFKFTFINGIELFIAALLLSFIVIYICYKLGDRQYRKDYEKDYKYLKFVVENFNGNDGLLRKEIKKKFDEISTYSCKDYEKLQVLEKAFIQKFSGKKMQAQDEKQQKIDALTNFMMGI